MLKKCTAVIIGGIILAAAVTGCGAGGTKTDPDQSENQNQGRQEEQAASEGADTQSEGGVQTIRVWTNDANLQLLYEDAIASYNETTGREKGIAIEYQVFGSDYNDVLKVALAADQGPELYKFFSYGVADAVSQYGYASALAVVSAVIMGLITAVYFFLTKKAGDIV